MSCQTVARWMRDYVFELSLLVVDALLPAQADDVLELNKLWSFVLKKSRKRWAWVALCHRTRQIVAFYIGRRDTLNCQQLWYHVPSDYRHCQTVSYAWHTYPKVIPETLHRVVGKEGCIRKWGQKSDLSLVASSAVQNLRR